MWQPAESPATTTCSGGVPRSSSHRYARSASSSADGNGCSGASRYSGTSAALPAAAANAPTSGREPKAEPITKPPPWRWRIVAGAPGAGSSSSAGTPPAITERVVTSGGGSKRAQSSS